MAKKHGPRKAPDADWNDPEYDPDDVLEQCGRIRELIEDADAAVWDKATNFLEDVDERVKGISETIERTRRVSMGQKKALDNWEAAVKRCIESEE